MIDLHMHTTASDGRCTPEGLIDDVCRVGIHTIAVTDHDTLAGVQAATVAAAARGVTVIPGIEITSVHDGRDVHMLAYFVSEETPGLSDLLRSQRQNRLDRALEIAERLTRVGAPIEPELLVDAATAPGGKALARPQIAQMLVDAGHVASIAEAFDRFLAEDGPAYVPHTGASPLDVVTLVTRGGGAASLAHPGYRGAGKAPAKDDLVPALADAGMTALEAFHSSHDAAMQDHYLQLARRYGLAVTGGADYHGPGTRRSELFGVVNLPVEYFDEFVARAASGRTGIPALHAPAPIIV